MDKHQTRGISWEELNIIEYSILCQFIADLQPESLKRNIWIMEHDWLDCYVGE